MQLVQFYIMSVVLSGQHRYMDILMHQRIIHVLFLSFTAVAISVYHISFSDRTEIAVMKT